MKLEKISCEECGEENLYDPDEENDCMLCEGCGEIIDLPELEEDNP